MDHIVTVLFRFPKWKLMFFFLKLQLFVSFLYLFHLVKVTHHIVAYSLEFYTFSILDIHIGEIK